MFIDDRIHTSTVSKVLVSKLGFHELSKTIQSYLIAKKLSNLIIY